MNVITILETLSDSQRIKVMNMNCLANKLQHSPEKDNGWVYFAINSEGWGGL
jgi:hypothetical protein